MTEKALLLVCLVVTGLTLAGLATPRDSAGCVLVRDRPVLLATRARVRPDSGHEPAVRLRGIVVFGGLCLWRLAVMLRKAPGRGGLPIGAVPPSRLDAVQPYLSP
jgi:hypothetical protein